MRIISTTVTESKAVDIAADEEITSWVVKRQPEMNVVDEGDAQAGHARRASDKNFHHKVDPQSPGTYLITVTGPSGSTSVTVTIR